MDEKPIRQSSLVVLQVLCVKLKCLVQLESAVIHHQVLIGRGSRKRWKQSRLIFHIINSSKGNNFCQIQSKKGGSCIQFGLQKFQKKGNVLSRIQFLHVIYSERIWKLRVYIYLYIVFRINVVSCWNVKNVNCRPTFENIFCNLNKPNVNHHTKIVGYYRL